MAHDPILIIGGSGLVGRWAAKLLRLAYPDVPLLIGGRDIERASKTAADITRAEGVLIDLDDPEIGLGTLSVSAVATLFTDETNAVLRWAQRRGAGHISISPGIVELAPEVATYMNAPTSAPVVLGTEWMVGATSVTTLILAEEFGKVDTIRLAAVLDEQDDFGPAARADLERQTKTAPAALYRENGAWFWRSSDAMTSTIRACDGVEVEATAFSSNDVLALVNATGAPNISFDLALGTSSTRRAGGPISTEVIIDLSGVDPAGRLLRTRHAVVHPGGQMPLTGLGVALVLERLAGLNGTAPGPGLYFPSQMIDASTFIDRLTASGGILRTLQVDRT